MGAICERIVVSNDMRSPYVIARSRGIIRSLGGIDGQNRLNAKLRQVLDGRRIAIGCRRVVLDLGELFTRLFRFPLAIPHAGIETALCEQQLMRPPLDNLSAA